MNNLAWPLNLFSSQYSPFQRMATSSSLLLRPESVTPDCYLTFFFNPRAVDPEAKSTGSTFSIYPESDHLPCQLLASWFVIIQINCLGLLSPCFCLWPTTGLISTASSHPSITMDQTSLQGWLSPVQATMFSPNLLKTWPPLPFYVFAYK